MKALLRSGIHEKKWVGHFLKFQPLSCGISWQRLFGCNRISFLLLKIKKNLELVLYPVFEYLARPDFDINPIRTHNSHTFMLMLGKRSIVANYISEDLGSYYIIQCAQLQLFYIFTFYKIWA